MKYWSFNRDPDNGLHTLQSPHNWVVFHRILYTAKKTGAFFLHGSHGIKASCMFMGFVCIGKGESSLPPWEVNHHWQVLCTHVPLNPFNLKKRPKERRNRSDKLENTLPETNIAPENGWLEDYFPIGEAHLQGLCYFQGRYFTQIPWAVAFLAL